MQIRPLLLFAVVSLFLPALAAANSSQFRNTSGIITTGASTLTLTKSPLAGMGDSQGQNFGALNFSTGPLISGTLAGGAVFGTGSSIVVGSQPPAGTTTARGTTRCPVRSLGC